jgi:hypothetical protein
MRKIQEEIRGLYYVKEAEEDLPETWSTASPRKLRVTMPPILNVNEYL